MVKINFIHFSPDLSNFLQFKPILSTGEDFLNFIRIICQPCTQVNWRAHYASLVSQKLSRSLSWRIINSLIGEFDTNSSWSVRGCEVSRRDHLFWSKLSSNMVRVTVQLWYWPINKMYHPDSSNYIKTQRHITFIAPIGYMILSEN